MLLNILQCLGQAPSIKKYLAKMSQCQDVLSGEEEKEADLGEKRRVYSDDSVSMCVHTHQPKGSGKGPCAAKVAGEWTVLLQRIKGLTDESTSRPRERSGSLKLEPADSDELGAPGKPAVRS
ncbi:uncharacterized protein WM277_002515 isoform 2-T2 [Molossus nigricans]